MAELGESKNPRELVPGYPEEIDDSIAKLRQQSARFEAASEDLAKVKTLGWSGAASASFHSAFDPQAQRWRAISDALSQTANSLAGHSDVLRGAQRQATDAITLWQQGEAATQEAANKNNSTDTQLAAQTTSASPSDTREGASNKTLTDPGEQYREQAQQLLSRARSELEQSGRAVAAQISSRNAANNRSQDSLTQIANAVTRNVKADGTASAKGPHAGVSASGPSNGSLGQLQAFAYLGKASAQGSIGNEFMRTTAQAQASAGADATGSASATKEGLTARAEGSVAGKASAQAHEDIGPLGESASVSGFAGARARAGAQAGLKGINASADAFAGARATVKRGADVGGIGVNSTAEGWAGPGAEAKVEFGKGEDGKWHFGANAGVSPIVGGEVGAELTIDPEKVSKTTHEASEAVGHMASTVENSTGSAGRTISGWIH